MRKATRVAVVAASVAAGFVASAPAARADTMVTFRNGADPTAVATAPMPFPGAPVVLMPWTGENRQRWLQERVGGGVEFRNAATGMCLSVRGGSREPGAPVVQEPCNGLPAQVWGVYDTGDGRAFVTNVHSGRCLVPGGMDQVLRQYDCTDEDNGKWIMTPA